MNGDGIDVKAEPPFVVNSIHIGHTHIMLMDADGDTMYLPLSERCQKDQRVQAEELAEFWKSWGRRDFEQKGNKASKQ